MPDSFCETETGLLLIANGMQPVLRWNGLTSQAEPAGLLPPGAAVTLFGSGQGAILGSYYAYVRFLDEDGNVSNLSPLSALTDMLSFSGDIAGVSLFDFAAINALAMAGGSGATLMQLTSLIDTPVQVRTSTVHHLNTGARVRLAGAGGATQINGDWEIKVDGLQSFRLVGLTSISTFTGGGNWQAGVERVNYSGIPLPSEARVSRRQILRNTDGQTATFYVDIDTMDLAATEGLFSTLSDDDLSAQEAVPLLAADGSPLANRFTVPPNHKSVLATHLGRVFASVDVVYSEGCVQVSQGSLTVTGIGTEWTSQLATRFLYVTGTRRPLQIDSVDTAAQTLTLTAPYSGPSESYSRYAIRPAPGEARLIYYSDAGLPEAWPAINALSVAADDDDIVGLAVSGSFLYILERRHIYRFTFQSDPGVDGYVFLNVAGRGCLNHRTWVDVNGTLYMLDEQGVFRFDGSPDIQPLSMPIQDVFRSQEGTYAINWQAAEYFHAVHYAQQEAIRWFVSLGGDYLPRHALCFNYRLQRWWIEAFPAPVGASCLAIMNGQPVVLLGSSGKRVFKFWEGSLDGVQADAGTVRGSVTSASLLSLTAEGAQFASQDVVGAPVAIVAGKGRGQARVVTAVSGTTLSIDQPWLNLPDETSTYQLGGVEWHYRTGFFRFVADENHNPRRVEVLFNPVQHECLMDLRIFRDLLTTPLVWKTGYRSEDANGIKSEDGSALLTIDMTKPTGYVMKRFSGHKELILDGTRFWSLELSGFTNREPVVLGDLALEGADERDRGTR